MTDQDKPAPRMDAISATRQCAVTGCEAKATAGPGTASAPILGLEEQLCPGHLTLWYEAQRDEDWGAS